MAGVDAVDSAMNRVEQNARGALAGMSESMTNFGTAATLYTAPLAAGLAAASAAAVSFDEAMVNAGSILGKTRDEMEEVNAQVLALGSASRAGPQAAAEAYYTIVSGVQDASTHMAILEAAMKTAEAGSASLEGTTAGLVSVMNAYGMSADDAAFVSDVFTQTVSMGVGTMDEFAGALGPAAGLAKDLGIGFDELAANTALLTSTGSSASESVTQLTAMMTAFLNPNAKMQEALENMGYESGQAAIQALGLTGAVDALNESVGGSTGDMAAALGSTEALGGALGLMADNADEFTTKFIEGLEGVTDRTRELQMESVAAQMDLLKSSISGVAIQIGAVLLPGLIAFVDSAQPVVDWISSMIEKHPQFTAGIVATASAAVALGPALVGAGQGVRVLSMAFGALTNPVSLVMTILGGLYFAFQTNLFGIRDIVQPVIDTVVDKITGFTDRILPAFRLAERGFRVFHDILEDTGSVVQAFAGGASQALTNFMFGLGLITNTSDLVAFKGTVEDVFMAIGTAFTTVANFVTGTVLPALSRLAGWFINDALPAVVDFVTGTAIPAIGRFVDFLGSIWDIVSGGLESLLGWFTGSGLPSATNFVEGTALPIFEQFTNFLSEIWNTVSGALGSLADWFTGSALPAIANFVTGTALPALQAFFSFIGTVWDVVSGALGSVAGWFTGSALPAIAEFVTGTALPAIQSFFDFIGGVWATISPVLSSVATWFTSEALPNIATFVTDTALPAVQNFFNFIGGVWDQISGALGDVADWFTGTALPGIDSFLNDTVLVTFQAVFGYLGEVWEALRPGLEALAEWFLTSGLPRIQSLINDEILPTFQSFFGLLETVWTEILEPALTPMVTWFTEDGLPGIGTFLTDTLTVTIQSFIDLLSGAWALIQPLLEPMLRWFVEDGLPQVSTFIIETLIPAFDDILTTVEQMWADVEPVVILFRDGIDQAIRFIADTVFPLINEALAIFVERVTAVWEDISPHVESIRGGFETAFNFVKDNVIDPLRIVIDGILSTVMGVKNNIETPLNDVQGFFETALNFVKTNVIDPLRIVIDGILSSVMGVKNTIETPLNDVKGFFEGAFTFVNDMVITPMLGMITGITGSVQGVADTISTPLNAVKSIFETVFGAMLTVVDGVVGAIGGIASAVSDAGAAISSLGGTVSMVDDVAGAAASNPFKFIEVAVNAVESELSGNASGTPWTGNMGINTPAGIVHGQEAVVPHGGMQVIPSPRGLMIEGAVRMPEGNMARSRNDDMGQGSSGRQIVITNSTFVLQGIQDIEEFYDQLREVERKRA
ncbi:MAG: hypothetical protein OHK0046_47990 [Anaerolineae bacterium]